MSTLLNIPDFYTGTKLTGSAIHLTSPSLEFNGVLDFNFFIPLEVPIILEVLHSLLCLSMMDRRKYFTILQRQTLWSIISFSTKTHRHPMHIEVRIALMNAEIPSTSYGNTINFYGTVAN